MLDKMKEIYRDPPQKQEWITYAEKYGGSTYDPTSHTAEFTGQLLSTFHPQYTTVARLSWPQPIGTAMVPAITA